MFGKNKFFNCKDNGLILIKGKDKFEFIQGIISNDINILKKKSAIYSAILTPQGKFLYDFFISNFNDQFYIESKKENINELFQKISIYKLRSNVEISILNNLEIFLIDNLNESKVKKVFKNNLVSFSDPRFNEKFSRLYIKKSAKEILEKLGLNEVDSEFYNNWRLENAIPDFYFDSIKGKSLLLEMRFEDLNGLSWDKGCFLGQEITARMKYRGIVKRKIFSVKIEFNSFLEKKIYLNEKLAGQLMSNNKNFGLAYLQEEFTKNISKDKFDCGDSKIELSPPFWINK